MFIFFSGAGGVLGSRVGRLEVGVGVVRSWLFGFDVSRGFWGVIFFVLEERNLEIGIWD